jgi:pyrroloquinoline quinone biosynthesis protein D
MAFRARSWSERVLNCPGEAVISVQSMEPIRANDCPRLAARARVQKDTVTGKPVLLYPEGVLMLNPTGDAIVALCDGTKTFEQIAGELATRYSMTVEQISSEVSSYLDRLRARNLVEMIATTPE